jgi:uridine kinase
MALEKFAILIIGPPRGGKTTLGKFLSTFFQKSISISLGEYHRQFQSEAKRIDHSYEEFFVKSFNAKTSGEKKTDSNRAILLMVKERKRTCFYYK